MPRAYFYKDKHAPLGVTYWCRACTAAKRKPRDAEDRARDVARKNVNRIKSKLKTIEEMHSIVQDLIQMLDECDDD